MRHCKGNCTAAYVCGTVCVFYTSYEIYAFVNTVSCTVLYSSYNPLPRLLVKYNYSTQLRLSLVLYFACSPQKWVITTT